MNAETEVLPEVVTPPTEANVPALFDEEDDIDAGDGTPPAEGEGTVEAPATESEDELQTRETKRFSEMRKSWNGTLKDNRRLQRELEELRAKSAPPKPTLGPKPKLESFDYDEGRFEQALEEWKDQERAVKIEEQRKQEAERQEQEALETHKRTYAERARSLGVDDFPAAEQEIRDVLNPTQIGLLMRGADDPAGLVYALGKSPTRLIEASKITDPVKFTVHIARLETSLSAKRNTRPAPEVRVTSERSATGFSAADNELERLRKEAERTGDYTKVSAYKRQLKAK